MALSTTQLPLLAKGSYYPPNDQGTYRDLLLFEERLKTNAASLNRRKRRYQLFLAQLVLIIMFLLSQVFLHLNMLDIPYRLFLRKAVPHLYPESTLQHVHVHPYVTSGLLFVSVTTLILFFASGMYSEKIGYANRYVPHANRALRGFNMYLNVRQPPLSLNPLSLTKSRTTQTPAPPSKPSTPPAKRSASSVPIPTIPPSTNPRGELIFSSKVDKSFRESYERYRTAFEQRRERHERIVFFTKTWLGRVLVKLPWSPFAVPASVGSAAAGDPRAPGHVPSRPLSSASFGRGAKPGGTPTNSRRSSPVPATRGGGRSPSRSRAITGTPENS